jgi:hypothetical protein
MSENGPPDTLTAEELVHHFANRPAPEKIVDLPESMHIAGEKYKKIRIVIPPEKAEADSRFDALTQVRGELKKRYGREIKTDDLEPKIVQDLVGDRCAKEMLARCIFAPQSAGTIGDSDKPILKRVFMSADHIEQSMHSDEIAILYALMMSVMRELGPRQSVLIQDKETLQLWVDRLKEGAWSLGPLEWLALADLQELCCAALRLLATYADSGLPLLSESFEESLRGLISTQTNSDLGNTFSGEPAESSVPSTNETLGIEPGETISADKALELAAKLRRP